MQRNLGISFHDGAKCLTKKQTAIEKIWKRLLPSEDRQQDGVEPHEKNGIWGGKLGSIVIREICDIFF